MIHTPEDPPVWLIARSYTNLKYFFEEADRLSIYQLIQSGLEGQHGIQERIFKMSQSQKEGNHLFHLCKACQGTRSVRDVVAWETHSRATYILARFEGSDF